MTTEIRNFAGDRAVRIYPIRHRGQSGVGVMIRQNGEYVLDAHLPRADFLAAVASELDAIVIPRADLPATKELDRGYVQVEGLEMRDFPPQHDHRRLALGYLAVMEHHRTAVDEAEVEALAQSIAEAERAEGIVEDELDQAAQRILARHLIAAGWKR